MKPLEGIRILDLTRVLAGPFCTALMADLGAEVIKLEPPQGDDHRHIGPFVEGESALFALTNRGKQSLVVNLKSEEGQSLVRRFETVAMSWWKTSVPAYDTVVQAMSGLMDATGEEGGAPCHRQGDPDPRRLRVYPRFPLERHGRDLRIMLIYEGSSEIQRDNISGHLLAA